MTGKAVFQKSVLRRIAFGSGLAVLSLLSVVQLAASPKQPPAVSTPANWIGEWRGAGLSGKGSNVPPGFTTENSYMMLDKFIDSHLQPWALAKKEATDWDTDDTGAVCELDGIFRGFPIGGFQLLTAPGEIVLVPGGIETTGIRRIYLSRPHLKNPPLTWNGDSVGHWDGDTLIVDTTGFNDKSWLMSDREPHSEKLHVIEKFQSVDGGTFMEIQTTVEDPEALTTSFGYTRFYKKAPATAEMADSVCNENTAPWRRMKQAAEKKAALQSAFDK